MPFLATTEPFDGAADENPAWSPNGGRIAFDSNRSGNLDVYSMNADGSGVKQLTTSPALDALPAWSPDGSELVFESDRGGKGNRDLYEMTRNKAESDNKVKRVMTHVMLEGQAAGPHRRRSRLAKANARRQQRQQHLRLVRLRVHAAA